MENNQARGERERETLARSNETIKQRLEEGADTTRLLASRITLLEEANEKLRAELTKIEKIRLGLEAFGQDGGNAS